MQFKWFINTIKGSFLFCLAFKNIKGVRTTAENNHFLIGANGAYCFKRFNAAHSRHMHIQKNHIEFLSPCFFYTFNPVRSTSSLLFSLISSSIVR